MSQDVAGWLLTIQSTLERLRPLTALFSAEPLEFGAAGMGVLFPGRENYLHYTLEIQDDNT